MTVDVEHALPGGLRLRAPGGVRVSVSGTLIRNRIGEWRAGRLLRMPVLLKRPARYLNPGVADQEVSLARRGICLVGSVKSGALVEVVARGDFAAEMSADVRAWVRRAIQATVGRWSARSSAIVTAILVGDRSGLDEQVERRLQQAGTYHVIAISGGNIAILAGVLLGVLRLGGVSHRPAAAATIICLLAYAFIVRGGASVSRATLVAVVYLAARLGDHRTPPINSLAVAAILIVCATPLSIFDAAFALTFGATLGILLGAGPLVERFRNGLMAIARSAGDGRWLKAPLAVLAATICAELALFPIGIYVFSRVSFAGIALNFLAIPLMTVAEVAGLAALVLTPAQPALAQAAGFVAHQGAHWLVETSRFVDLAPWLTSRLPAPGLPVLTAYFGGWIVWLACPRNWRLRRLGAATIAATAVWMLVAPPWFAGAAGASETEKSASRQSWLGAWRASPGRLRVTFLDVGQGDAILVRFPDGRALLVDTGGLSGGGFDVGARVVSPALWALGVRRLDYLALTHGDPDHIGGASAVLRDFRPRELWEGVSVPNHEPSRLLEEEAIHLGAARRTLQSGDVVQIGDTVVRVWHPPPPDWERQKVRNDDSLVIELTRGRVSLLLTGDISREVERELAPRLRLGSVRIVKAPHHGSGTSSSPEFIAATRPAIVIFSAGRGNLFGHPAWYVVRRYREAGAGIFRTDEDGAVSVETDGYETHVRTWAGRAYSVQTTLPPVPGI